MNAWREALDEFADPARFTSQLYEAHGLAGALAASEALEVSDARLKAAAHAERKQARLQQLIRAGNVVAFPDALRFLEAVMDLGWPMAAASSSKNANSMMKAITLSCGRCLLDAFTRNVCGRDVVEGSQTQPSSCLRPRS